MNYYLKPSEIIFSWRTFLFAITLLDFFLVLTAPSGPNDYYLDYYSRLAILLLTAIMWIFPSIRLLWYWMSGKPALFVDNIFIHNYLDDRIYYWGDIQDALAENDYLKITLKENPAHPVRPYNGISRLMKKILSKKAAKMRSYYIYIYVLDVDRAHFLEALNNYSIPAEN